MTETTTDRAPLEQRIDAYLRGVSYSDSPSRLLQEAFAEITQLRFAAKCAIEAREPAVSETTAQLIAMQRQRDRTGLAKYGTTLDRTDLTPEQWMQHAIEELLDAAGYLQALKRTLSTRESGHQRCESGAPECGPVEFHDAHGVPLCRRCWNELPVESVESPPGEDGRTCLACNDAEAIGG